MKPIHEYDIKLREGTRSDNAAIYVEGKVVIMKWRKLFL